jgi:hypothetical protein
MAGMPPVVTITGVEDGETSVLIRAKGGDESIPHIKTQSVVVDVRGAYCPGSDADEQIMLWAKTIRVIMAILAANPTILMVNWGSIGLDVPSLHPRSSDKDKRTLVEETTLFRETETEGIIVVSVPNPTFMSLPGSVDAVSKAVADAQKALKAGRGGIFLALLHNDQLDYRQAKIAKWVEEQEVQTMQKLSD